MWRFKRNPKFQSSRGDTIVEVLIAIAIVSTVLAGAFTVTQKSTQAVRDSQERSEVLQLLQGQVEMVRDMALKATSTDDPPFAIAGSPTSKYFCIDNDPTSATVNQPVPFTQTDISANNYQADYPNACRGLGSGKLYNIAVSYDDTTNVFSFEAHWDGVTGSTDNERLAYRIYPGKPVPPPAPAPSPSPSPSPGPPPLSLVTCENLAVYQGVPGYTYANVKNYPSGSSTDDTWHVAYNDPSPSKPIHSISPASVPYTFSPNLTPGKYYMWSISKDNSYSTNGLNKRLHYNGYAPNGSLVFKTNDTGDLPATRLPGYPPDPEGYWFSGTPVTISQPVKYLRVEHAPNDNTSPDDSVDADCFVTLKVG